MIGTGKVLRRLNEMLDSALDGSFEEYHYDETELSKIETKWNRFLSSSSLARKNILHCFYVIAAAFSRARVTGKMDRNSTSAYFFWRHGRSISWRKDRESENKISAACRWSVGRRFDCF